MRGVAGTQPGAEAGSLASVSIRRPVIHRAARGGGKSRDRWVGRDPAKGRAVEAWQRIECPEGGGRAGRVGLRARCGSKLAKAPARAVLQRRKRLGGAYVAGVVALASGFASFAPWAGGLRARGLAQTPKSGRPSRRFGGISVREVLMSPSTGSPGVISGEMHRRYRPGGRVIASPPTTSDPR
jgi:hypothetical protein